jgi:inorganic pyrophosphatase
VSDVRFKKINNLEDLNPHLIEEVKHFFLTYKQLQNKKVEINGIEGAEAAKAVILEGIEMYKKEFKVA